jgi:uncharacterized membrane protein
MNHLGCGILCLALALALALPIFFHGVMVGALADLGMGADIAFLLLLGILIGSAINIPLWRFDTNRYVRTDPLAILGLTGLLPNLEDRRLEVQVALNVGGCLIPLALVAYEVARLASGHPGGEASAASPAGTLIALCLAVALNVVICWKLARPIPGIGIVVPGIVPGIVAATSALLVAADTAAPVACVAGVLGPIIGGSILHLRDLRKQPVGLASIGGAGSFDGIVFALVLSAFLA